MKLNKFFPGRTSSLEVWVANGPSLLSVWLSPPSQQILTQINVSHEIWCKCRHFAMRPVSCVALCAQNFVMKLTIYSHSLRHEIISICIDITTNRLASDLFFISPQVKTNIIRLILTGTLLNTCRLPKLIEYFSRLSITFNCLQYVDCWNGSLTPNEFRFIRATGHDHVFWVNKTLELTNFRL